MPATERDCAKKELKGEQEGIHGGLFSGKGGDLQISAKCSCEDHPGVFTSLHI